MRILGGGEFLHSQALGLGEHDELNTPPRFALGGKASAAIDEKFGEQPAKIPACQPARGEKPSLIEYGNFLRDKLGSEPFHCAASNFVQLQFVQRVAICEFFFFSKHAHLSTSRAEGISETVKASYGALSLVPLGQHTKSLCAQYKRAKKNFPNGIPSASRGPITLFGTQCRRMRRGAAFNKIDTQRTRDSVQMSDLILAVIGWAETSSLNLSSERNHTMGFSSPCWQGKARQDN